ncbi:MAG: hypothetical protein WBV28_00125 [Terracidiphilus sp.]
MIFPSTESDRAAVMPQAVPESQGCRKQFSNGANSQYGVTGTDALIVG